MRILYVCTDADIGGAERLLLALGRHADPRDEVGLVVLMGPGTLSPLLNRAFSHVEYLGFPASSRNLPGMVAALGRAVRRFRPDVISSHLFHADLVTALARVRVPRTTTVHTQALGGAEHPLTRLIARAVGMLSFRFDAVIPVGESDDMRAFLSRLGYRRVESPIINPGEIPDTPLFRPESRRLVSIARSHPVKGHAVLFQAFASVAPALPEWTLACFGPGVVSGDPVMEEALSRPGLRELVAAGRILLGGPVSEPGEVLRDAAALVISSRYGETFPLVGTEAAGAGVPVISTDVGSCAEFVDSPPFLVRAGDSDALARALESYARLSDSERRDLSRRARVRAERSYAPQVVVAAYRSVFERITSSADA